MLSREYDSKWGLYSCWHSWWLAVLRLCLVRWAGIDRRGEKSTEGKGGDRLPRYAAVTRPTSSPQQCHEMS